MVFIPEMCVMFTQPETTGACIDAIPQQSKGKCSLSLSRGENFPHLIPYSNYVTCIYTPASPEKCTQC